MSTKSKTTTNKGNLLPDLISTVPTNLPALRSKLIGRDADMKTILGLFERKEVRLVTLAGFGGAGKTTLALHAAHNLLERFSGGVFFIDLTSIHEPTLILPTLSAALGLQEDPSREVAATLHDFLSNRSILFVLDNFEQLVSGANILADFLDSNPHICLLVTSRESLRLRGEHTLPLAPLESADAMQVFVQYAQTLNPHFRLTEDNTPAITELCKKLDGLPLAIELAAMRTRMFTPQALLARLTSDLETDSPILATLTSGPRDMPERQRTLRTMVEWSYNLLTEPEKQMLQAAAFFRSGFEIRTLASVAAVPEKEAEDILASLVDKNLIKPFHGAEMRFHLLESIREFALEQVKESPHELALQANFVFVFQTLVQEAIVDIETTRGFHGIPWLKAESNNMLAALEIAIKVEDKKVLSAGMAVLEGFEHYWFPHCYYSEAKKYLNLALQRVEENGSDLDKAIVYGLLGTLQWSLFNIQAAIDFHRRSVDLFASLSDDKRLGRALNNLAANIDFSGEYKDAEQYYLRSLNLSRQTGDKWNELRVLCNLGNNDPLYTDENRQINLNKAHDLATQLGRNYELTIIGFNLACISYRSGDKAQSDLYLKQCLQSADQNGYMQVGIYTRGLMGIIAIDQKQYLRAKKSLANALEILSAYSFQILFYEVVEVLARLCANTYKIEDATLLYASAADYLSRNSHARVLPLPSSYTERFNLLKKELGAERFELISMQGKQMTYSEVFARAVSLCAIADNTEIPQPADTIFTQRELDVLRLLAQGKTNEEISKELVVVLKTVEKHVASIFRKLGVKNRTAAAAWALENGMEGK